MLNSQEPADKSLQDKKEHGNLEYPVALYTLNLSKMHSGFIRWHWHEELEISVVTSGTAEFQISEDCYQLTVGQGMLINQNVLHAIHPIGNEECTIRIIVFHPAYLFGYGETYMCTKYLVPVVGSSSFKCHVINREQPLSDKMMNILNAMVEINSKRDFGYEISMKGCLCSLWLIVLEICLSEKPCIKETSLSSDEARAKHALIYIQEHYNENISLDMISAAIHVSKSECCRCFKRTLRMTPFEYLIKYRIYMAALLIVQQDSQTESIAELATTVGFNSTSYFNKWFRIYMKCTPTQYRKNAQTSTSIEFYST